MGRTIFCARPPPSGSAFWLSIGALAVLALLVLLLAIAALLLEEPRAGRL